MLQVGAMPMAVAALGIAAAVDLIPDDGGAGTDAPAVGMVEAVVAE